MIKTPDNAIRILNELIAVSRDSEQGFQLAAMDVTEPDLARLFAEYSAQRAKFAIELEQRVRTLRGDPVKTGNALSAAHRAWMDLKAALAANEIHAVLSECERGEDMAIKVYASALGDPDVDGETRRLIQSQYELVQATHDRIRQLRDSATYAHR